MSKPERPESDVILVSLPREEAAFLREFAKAGVASRRVWKIVVMICGGLAAICGAIAGFIGVIHLLRS